MDKTALKKVGNQLFVKINNDWINTSDIARLEYCYHTPSNTRRTYIHLKSKVHYMVDMHPDKLMEILSMAEEEGTKNGHNQNR